MDDVHGCTSVAVAGSKRATVGGRAKHDSMEGGGRAPTVGAFRRRLERLPRKPEPRIAFRIN